MTKLINVVKILLVKEAEEKMEMSMYQKQVSDYYANKLPYVTRRTDKVVYEAYRAEEVRLYNSFKEEALEDVGLENHPKKELIFSKAWADGHANGYHEVFVHLVDLTDFVRNLED